jgi:hypothetical protein
MTTPSTARKAGPLLGNGSTTAFPFTFKVFAAADVAVTIANSSGVETLLVLNTNYTVTLNSNQDTSPGGTVNYPISGSALPVGSVLAIIGDLDYDQALDLPSGGNFSPTALENQLDRSTMQIQQLREEMNRTAKLPPTSPESVEELVDDLQRIAGSADNLDTVANNIAAVNTVADDLNEPVSEINTVATSIANVNTVGNNITNVNTVAGISANVTTVAGIQANVTTVAGISANVATVAGISADVSAVAAIDDAVNTSAANIAAIQVNAANIVDIQNAEENAASVVNAIAQVQDGVKDRFVGGVGYTVNTTTQLTLSATPLKAQTVQVYFAGVYQEKTTYTLAGNVITFGAPIPASSVEVTYDVGRSFAELDVAVAAADTDAASAAASSSNASASAASALTSKNAAQAAAEASGSVVLYDTKALANAAVAGLADLQVVEVVSDETRQYARTRYRKESGALVFKYWLPPSLQTDLLGRTMVPRRYLDSRENIIVLEDSLYDVRAGTRKALRMLTIGDSLATVTQQAFFGGLGLVLRPNFPSDTVYSIDFTNATTSPQACTAAIIGPTTAVRTEKSNYNVSFVGTQTVHTVGQISYWGLGGFSIFCDRILIPIAKEPGAGSVKIEIAEAANAINPHLATWRNPTGAEIASGHALTGSELIVSANAASGCDVVALQFASVGTSGRLLRVTSTSGTVRILDVMFEVRNQAAINTYTLAASSNGFASTTTASVPVMAQFIAAYDPDIIVVVSDDSLAAYQNFLPHLDSALTQAALTIPPLVILAHNPGIGAGGGTTQVDLIDRADFSGFYASSRGWANVDGLAYGLGITNINTFRDIGDNIHLNRQIWDGLARRWAHSHGLLRYREDLPGGNVASRADISAVAGERQINASNVQHAAIAAQVADTGWMTWAAAVAGTAAGVKDKAFLKLTTGTTAGSTVRMYVDESNALIGRSNQGRIAINKRGSVGMTLKSWVMSANAQAWLLLNDVGWNSGYAALAGSGFGFRLLDNVLTGVGWRTGALVVTSGSVTLSEGVLADGVALQATWVDIGASRSDVTFFADGVSLGTLTVDQAGTCRLGLNLTNGSNASNSEIHVLPPRVALVK